MSLTCRAETFSVLENPLVTKAGVVTSWRDAGSIALCDYPIKQAYERVTGALSEYGFVDTMSEYRDEDQGVGQQPTHLFPEVREVLSEYHSTVAAAMSEDWVKIQTTMRVEYIVKQSANSMFHVDGVSVTRPDYVYTSAQKIVAITAYPNPTEFVPRGTVLPGNLFDLFAVGNVRSPERLAADALAHPGKIALFGYSQSVHREPPIADEQLGIPRLILRSFISI